MKDRTISALLISQQGSFRALSTCSVFLRDLSLEKMSSAPHKLIPLQTEIFQKGFERLENNCAVCILSQFVDSMLTCTESMAKLSRQNIGVQACQCSLPRYDSIGVQELCPLQQQGLKLSRCFLCIAMPSRFIRVGLPALWTH